MGFSPQADQPLPPTTTTQQDLTTAGQRKVNLIWEFTQAIIAVMLVGAFVTVIIRITFRGAVGQEVPAVLAAVCGTVVGSYFQRTNHMNIGGIGRKPQEHQPYEGR
jgi:hypothetical protein